MILVTEWLDMFHMVSETGNSNSQPRLECGLIYDRGLVQTSQKERERGERTLVWVCRFVRSQNLLLSIVLSMLPFLIKLTVEYTIQR